MVDSFQSRKAADFLALHHGPKLLVLPNIWDAAGARMLESMGYPAVATASSSLANSLGYDDGQLISFDALLDAVRRIVSAVAVPVTVDIERGYADTPKGIAENVRRLIRTGVVGLNIEDSTVEGGPLISAGEQAQRIRAIREMADGEGVHVVINARIDVYLGGFPGTYSQKLAETIDRARIYLDAGADCIYPITLGDLSALKALRDATHAPINVYANATAPSMRDLEAAGVSRLSLGPWMMRASLATLHAIARDLLDYGAYDRFVKGALPRDEIRKFLITSKMDET